MVAVLVVCTSLAASAQNAEVRKPRYYLSTNVLSLVVAMPNVGFEVRGRGAFGFKTSLFGGQPWLLNNPMDGSERIKTRLVGVLMEPRWYSDRPSGFYKGFSVTPLWWHDHETGPQFGDSVTVPSLRGWMVNTNFVVGWNRRLSDDFGVDCNLGLGVLATPGSSMDALPGFQLGVSVSWQVGK